MLLAVSPKRKRVEKCSFGMEGEGERKKKKGKIVVWCMCKRGRAAAERTNGNDRQRQHLRPVARVASWVRNFRMVH